MEVAVVNESKKVVLAHRARVLRSLIAKMRGLMLRSELPLGEGVVIVRGRDSKVWAAIHTLFMRFPIDVLFVDSKGKIVDLVEDLEPWRFYIPREKCRLVVELPAGTIFNTDTRVGDEIRLEKPSLDIAIASRVQSRKNATKALATLIRDVVDRMNLRAEVYYNPHTGGVHIGGDDKYFLTDAIVEFFGDDVEVSEGRTRFLKDEYTFVIRVKDVLSLSRKLGKIRAEPYVILRERFGGRE